MLFSRFFTRLSLTLALLLAASAALAGPTYLSFEQRRLLTHALRVIGQPDMAARKQALKNLQPYIQALTHNEPRRTQVSSYEEFLKLYRGDWADTGHLERDLQLAESREPRLEFFFAKDPALNAQIEEMQKAPYENLRGLLKSAPVSVDQSWVATQALKLSTGVLAEGALKAVEARLREIFTEAVAEVGRRVAIADRIRVENQALHVAVTHGVELYYQNLSAEKKMQIMAALLGADLSAPPDEIFRVILNNSGPQIKKLVQVVARGAKVDPELEKVFRSLENDNKAAPWSELQDIIAAEKTNYEFLEISHQALKVGSMAQVHTGRIRTEDGNERDVVVRFIKPGLREWIAEEGRVMVAVAKVIDQLPEMQTAGSVKFSDTVSLIEAGLKEELEVDRTLENQERAQGFYQGRYKAGGKSLRFHVPVVYRPRTAKSEVLVQERVRGEKLDSFVAKFGNEFPGLRQQVGEDLAREFFTALFFGARIWRLQPGFLHADLHQGNFLVEKTEAGVTVHLLDFGMGGEVPLPMLAQFIKLEAAVRTQDLKEIGESLWALSEASQNKISESEFHARILKMNFNSLPKADDWVSWSLKQGLAFSPIFGHLNRGVTLISLLLKDVNSTQTIEDVMSSLTKRHPLRTLRFLRAGKTRVWPLVRQKILERKSGAAVLRCESVFAN